MDSIRFIDNLNRDKARGDIAPHQIILLLSLLNIYLNENNIVYDIKKMNSEFRKVWSDYKGKFKSENCNLGLPLKAFVKRGYIEIKTTQNINDFRSKKELESKISAVKINGILIELFSNINLKDNLISRIDN
ncbi:hypothetical protein JYT50_01175 [bacterium AH-315-A23]|nr:hypothetical protein [bacterium AH-315-A23]